MSWLRRRPSVHPAERRRVRRRLAGLSTAAELRLALADLGPLFAAFGRYLSGRPDLFPIPFCRELLRLDEPAERLLEPEVERLLAAGLGNRPEAVIDRFDTVPCACTLAVQTHRGRLRGGGDVEIRLARPDLARHLEAAGELLPLAISAPAWKARMPALARAPEDFLAHLRLCSDLAAQARALAALSTSHAGGRGGRERALPATARMVRVERATPELLLFRRPAGRPLQDLLRPAPAGGNAGVGDRVARAAARRLCQAWLRPALRAGWALEPAPLEAVTDGQGWIVLAPGPACQLGHITSRHLWAYCDAAAGDGADGQLRWLLSEMDGTAPAAEERAWLRRVRQAVPLRDGGWEDGGEESLAESLFLHWRLATALGYVARPPLLAFFRGLFAVALAARRLSPGRDVLREALDELRLEALLGRIGTLLHAGSWPRRLARQLTTAAQPSDLETAPATHRGSAA